MLVTENGLEFASAYIEFENSVLSDLIRSFFPESLHENRNALASNSLAVNQGDFVYRGRDTIEGAHVHDFFLEPQKGRNEKYTEWELPLGPKKVELFAPLFARIIENNFSDCTKPLVEKLILESEEIAKCFVSFTWTHTDEGDAENDEGEPCFEQVVTKFVYTGDKIKKTRRRKQM